MKDDLEQTLLGMGAQARAAAAVLRGASAEQRTSALLALARELRARADAILAVNARDVEDGRAMGLATAPLDRLALDAARVEAMAKGVEAIAAQPDPVGVELARWTPPNGLDIARISTPIGVLAVIYEARPNVGIDVAALCLRSANAAILRGGSEVLRTALALQEAVAAALASAGLPPAAIQMIDTPDRDAVGLLLGGLDGAVDLLIPRGGKSLVERVQREARVPVLGHLEGLCHTFVHAAADPVKARAIVLDAKLRRVTVCGSTETLLVDRGAFSQLLVIAEALMQRGCELRGDAEARAVVPGMIPATEADWRTEHLAAILNVRVVDGVGEAAAHIARYGTGHTEAIVTENAAAAEAFIAAVDSAIVLVNASTQFADGGEFGFGGEIGIATGRLHARGPVGAAQLTTFHYVVRGTGQVRG